MNWWKLRSVGNLAVLKVSYLVLVVAPLLSEHQRVVNSLGLPLWLIANVFFASLSLAIANLLYDIFCPVIVKRFASPNDLYEQMLAIKDVSVRLYPGDAFDASLAHCKTAYNTAAAERPVARTFCSMFYFSAAAFFGILFAYRTWLVIEGLLRYYVCGIRG